MQSVKDTYQRITDTIIQQLEAGTKPWIRHGAETAAGRLRRSAPPVKPIAASTWSCCGSPGNSPATTKKHG